MTDPRPDDFGAWLIDRATDALRQQDRAEMAGDDQQAAEQTGAYQALVTAAATYDEADEADVVEAVLQRLGA